MNCSQKERISRAYGTLITQIHLMMSKFEGSSPALDILDEIRQMANRVEWAAFQPGCLPESHRLNMIRESCSSIVLYMESLKGEGDVIVTGPALKIVRESVDKIREALADQQSVLACA